MRQCFLFASNLHPFDGHIELSVLCPFGVEISAHCHFGSELDQGDVVVSLAGAAFNASVDVLLAVLNVFFLGRYPKPSCLGIELPLRGCHFIKVSGSTVAERVVKAHPPKGPKLRNNGPQGVGLRTLLRTAMQKRSV